MDEGGVQSTVPGYGVYVIVWAGLVALTGLTVAVSRAFGGVLAPLLIASVKSGLVVSYFMHMRHERGVLRLILWAMVAVFIVLFWFLFSDVAYR